MNAIYLHNETGQAIEITSLKRAVRVTLRMQAAEMRGTVTILLTGDEQVRALNREYRGVDRVTDVLSFPALPHGIETEEKVLGDLVVALPWTALQAQQAGHNLLDDLMLLMVHGTLHLLGHTHETEQERAAMWLQQDTVLQQLGLSPNLVPGLEQDPILEEARQDD